MRPSIPVLFATSLLGACITADDAEQLSETESFSKIATPANMGRYCSITYPGGGWGFASNPNTTDDPCNWMLDQTPGGTIQRAGLYSTNAGNRVVTRCDGGYVARHQNTGATPLTNAYNAAAGKSGCIFTVSPKAMPVFGLPYDSWGYTSTGTGMDFARDYTVDALNDFGDPSGSTSADELSWRGIDQSGSGGYIDDHDGWDINMIQGTPIRAVAHGTVKASRFRDVTAACPTTYMTPTQGEVFIKHTVSGGSNSNEYDEQFVTFYAHMSVIYVADGDVVNKGDIIGLAGTTGCSSGPHLHLGTFRLTNTASEHDYPFVINTSFGSPGDDENSANGYQIAIDPRGFSPAKGFDPWAWRGYPWGALSVNLWQEGSAPPAGSY
jgi:murein DD-endopeptidase MepM/ murein hydrolase activator NlpD